MGNLLGTVPELDAPFVYAVLAALPFKERASLALVCKAHRRTANSPIFKRWLCERLAAEHKLYVPCKLPHGVSWASFFKQLWPCRNLFEADAGSGSGARAALEPLVNSPLVAPDETEDAIRVIARFRPARPATATRDGEDVYDLDGQSQQHGKMVTLPLHQRLQLLKMSSANQKGSGSAPMSTREALQQLRRQGQWFGAATYKETTATASAQSFHVGAGDGTGGGVGHGRKDSKDAAGEDGKENAQVRVPPPSLVAQVHSLDEGTGTVVMLAPTIGLRQFAFDHVTGPASTQRVVFDTSSRNAVIDVLNGFNATIIAYGQTGSGKTHTMFGPPGVLGVKTQSVSPDAGIVPRASLELLAAVQQRARLNVRADLFVSYVEVFGDTVSDLLDGGHAVSHSKVAASRYVLDGERRVRVNSMGDVEECLARGDAQKRRAATAMNDHSSRAHALFILSLEQYNEENGVLVKSQLFLADLGGSEQIKKSKVQTGAMTAHEGFVQHENLREAVNINLGLLALKKCIEAKRRRADYVPYQDSKLTMLLSAGLGGNSKTSVVVCGSMEPAHATETLQALRFGESCSRVQTGAQQGHATLTNALKSINDEITVLEKVIKQKEYWEHKEEVRHDALLEEGTFEAAQAKERGGETVRTSRLVGAEVERARLEQLLRTRMELLGDKSELSFAAHGFGGVYGGKATALGGHAEHRFQVKSEKGLLVKGKKVAEWQD